MNKKFLAVAVAVALFLLVGSMCAVSYAQCTKIQSGMLTDVNGNPITVGYDKYGYNYQAHIFNGLYENYSRPGMVVTEGTENLVMKWSDDWLANVDCNGDKKLDRGLNAKTGVSTGVSMGWVTNHFEGEYEGSDGELHHYTYFAKIAYVGPAPNPDPYVATRIWGAYAIIQEIQNDSFGEYGGRLHFVDKFTGPGLGFYTK
jgi:hypothetical protein